VPGAIDPNGLLLLAAIARAGSLSRAAAALNTVQPNVTSRLRAFEDAVGAPLFERHSRGVTPTRTGRLLLPFAHRVEAALREAGQALDDAETPGGALRIGSMETTAALRLPAILPDFTRAFPEVELVLRTGPTADLVAAVLAGELDAALVSGPCSDTRLVQEVVFREELVLVTSPGAAGAEPPGSAEGVRIVVFKEGCSYRERLERLLAERGVAVLRRHELGTLEGVLACIGAGLGIGLLPKGSVETARRAGLVATHALAPEIARVETLFIRRAGAFEPRTLRAFLMRLRNGSTTIRAAE
jgi:DNA-binding transcriptional LysR family regulator